MPASRRCLTTSCVARFLRIGALAVLAVTGVLLVLIVLHRGFLPILAWLFPSLETPFYDFAVYGLYRTENFVTVDLEAPQASVLRWDDSCDNGFVLVGPQGPSVTQPGPAILNPRGELIWTSGEFDTVMNFQMQQYRGEKYLTFWAGFKRGSMGLGAFFMLDSHYNVAYKVHAVGEGLKGDLHEFEITDEGTALITVYNNTQFDLRGMGWGRRANGWLMDSVFQEIDIASGELLFEWKASDYYKPEDSFYTHPIAGYVESIPFDFYHINSIQKDTKGNYLICSRHMHTVSYIDGTTGKPIWTLGGGYNDFDDLSDGLASAFTWQHHARWLSQEEGLLSLFDNGCAGPLHVDRPYSKGTILQLDVANRTATHLQSYLSLQHTRAASQGSVQLLENDQVFIGWGSSAAYSEHARDGTNLCEVHFAPSITFWWERVKSYRVYKFYDWIGRPENPPVAKIRDDLIYVSWNGATEVKFWELQGAPEDLERDGDVFETVTTIDKDTFEESIALPSKRKYKRYRVAALDSKRNVLDHSDPVGLDSGGISAFGVGLGIFAAVGSAVGVWYILKIWARRRNGDLFTWAPQRLFVRENYRYSKL